MKKEEKPIDHLPEAPHLKKKERLLCIKRNQNLQAENRQAHGQTDFNYLRIIIF